MSEAKMAGVTLLAILAMVTGMVMAPNGVLAKRITVVASALR